jgi:hypothetical protein
MACNAAAPASVTAASAGAVAAGIELSQAQAISLSGRTLL